MEELFSYQDIFNAYRRIKNYYYFDTNTIFLRYKISNFESQMGIGKNTTKEELAARIKEVFKPLHDVLNADEPTRELDSLGEISYKILPKKVSNKALEGLRYITNDTSFGQNEVGQCNFIIDVPVEMLVISALWVEYVGVKMCSCLRKDSYAYQVNYSKDVEGYFSLNSGISMFKPYFIGYQDWRDNALREANRLLDRGDDVSILSLDIKRFFYSARVNLQEIMKSCWDKKMVEDNQVKVLNSLLQEIHCLYASKINDKLELLDDVKNQTKDSFPLPVGLPSSGILGNLLMVDFDKNVWEKVCPVYYGRYVDDMLFVFSNRYVDNCNEDPVSDFVEAYFIKTKVLKSTENGEYAIAVLDKNSSVLTIQKTKVVLEHFSSKGSHAAIDIFLKELAQQRSEFRFLPDEDYISDEFDKEAYNLFFSDSSHKLRDIQNFKVDKYGASKYLAKRIFLSKLSELDNVEKIKADSKKTAYQLLNFFKGKTALDMYSLWEKVATYFGINQDWASLSKFYYGLRKEIGTLKISKECKGVEFSELTENLLELLNLSIAHSMALDPFGIDKEKKYFQDKNLKKLLKDKALKFRHSNMFKHNYLAIQGVNYTDNLLMDEVSLFTSDCAAKSCHVNEVLCFLSPVFIHFEELNLMKVYDKIESIVRDSETSEVSLTLNFEKIQEDYVCLNTEWQIFLKEKIKNKNQSCLEKFLRHKEDNNTQYLTLDDYGDEKKEYFPDKCVAIANKQVFESDFMHVVMRKAEKIGNERRNTLCRIINDANKNKADMLIMPELAVPFAWLGFLANQSIQADMAIVAGMEYVIGGGNNILNTVATILPVQTKYLKTCVIHLRVKNFYSPKEKIMLEGYHFNVPQAIMPKYTLFHWRKSYFSVYNCFELADINGRAKFQSMADFLIAVEFNKDVHYFSDVTGAWARDIHCFIIQVNTSQYGDSKVIMPSKSDFKTLLNVKGGENPVVMTATLPIKRLRDFQIADYQVQVNNNEFKFTPPNFNYKNVEKKINDEDLF